MTEAFEGGAGRGGQVEASALPDPPRVAPPSPPPPRPTWKAFPPATPWAPAEVHGAFPWAAAHRYADTVTYDVRVGSALQLLAISHRGRVHAHDAAHREDACLVAHGARGFVLVAADGAGSAELSRIGAEYVCREIVAAVRPLLDDGLGTVEGGARGALSRALTSAVESLQRAAAAAARPPRDFRTTALACLCLDDDVALVQVGDGAIIIAKHDGDVGRVGVGDSGSYSGEVTVFVPDVGDLDVATRVSSHRLSQLEAIVLVTDGIEDPFYPLERRAPELLRQLYVGVEVAADGFRHQAQHGAIVGADDAAATLARWIEFERRGENDDRTLVAAFRLPPGARR